MQAAIEVLWQVIAPILLTAGVGYALARKVGLQPRDLSRAAFYLLSPCLVFDKLSHTTLSPGELGRLAAIGVLTMAGSALIAWVASRLLGYDTGRTSAFMLVAFAGNTGNYGLPANQFAFGVGALEPAVIYYSISTLVISTAGVYLAASGQRSATAALRNALRVPLTYAGLAGLLVWILGWQVPLPIERAAALAGQGAVPVMLVLLGVQLAGVGRRNDVRSISLAALIKLLGGAFFALLLVGPLGISGLNRQVAILQAAMPTAVMTTVLATEYDADPHFAAGVVLASTLASLVTITLLLTWLR